MFVVSARNVNTALERGLGYLVSNGRREASRAGDVLVAPGPVTTVTFRPLERVLWSPVRDANPFFHLMESMWMLAGRSDAAFLNNYVKTFGERFAEPGGEVHGAYGRRWRGIFGFDQLQKIVEALRSTPGSRQAVLQMWDSHTADEFGVGENDLTGVWRDRPCNTHAYFRIRKETEVVGVSNAYGMGGFHEKQVSYLDLTICARSNDAIWGCHGANAVHFSFLQEYMAAMIGVKVGFMYQVSNNYHAYMSELDKLCGRASCSLQNLPVEIGIDCDLYREGMDGLSVRPEVEPTPLVENPKQFDEDLVKTITYINFLNTRNTPEEVDQLHEELMDQGTYNTFLTQPVWALAVVHRLYRLGYGRTAWGDYLDCMDQGLDWQRAASEWLDRRDK